MPERSVTHATFVVERTYNASPARVFNAWADPAVKSRWFKDPDDWQSDPYEFDFRLGGVERSGGGPPGGPKITYEARYADIQPDERLVTTYQMHMDGNLISVSVATLEFKPQGSGTRLIVTEQGAFLDGYDSPAVREHGTEFLLDALGEELRLQTPDA